MLKEYLEEIDHATGDIIFLKDEDYTIGVKFSISENNYHTSIFINNIPKLAGIEFILINGTGHLFTINNFRNPKIATPFYINQLKIKKL